MLLTEKLKNLVKRNSFYSSMFAIFIMFISQGRDERDGSRGEPSYHKRDFYAKNIPFFDIATTP